MGQAFRADIEGLRALAILPILLFHLDPALCPGGFLGVDIFFVISGFVITRAIIGAGANFSFSHFYRRRFFRLYPALLVTVFGTLAAAWKILSPESFVMLAKSALAAALGVSNFYFYFKTGYFDGSADDYPLLHTWSLGVEEQFYLVWPAVLLGLPLVFRRALWPGLVLIALASFVAALYARQDPDLTFYMMPFRVFELAWGAALATLPRLALASGVRGLVGAAGLVLVGVSCFYFDGNTSFPSLLSFVPLLGTTFLIVAGAEGVWSGVLGAEPLRFIGRISYAIYLVHWPVIALYKTKLVFEPTLSDIFWMFGLTVVLGLALHVLVENPFRRRPVRILSWAPPAGLSAAALCAILALPFAGSAAVLLKNGFPHRVDRVQDTETALSFAGDLCAAKGAKCAFGDTSSKDVVYLIGDSHALNLVHGLDVLFRAHHIKGLGVFDHGCLFLSQTTRFLKGVKDEKCARNVEEAFEILEKDTRPVIFAGAYDTYRNAIGPADATEPIQNSIDEYYAWIGRYLRDSFERLQPKRRTIIVFKQTYNTGVELAKCRSQPGQAGNCNPRDRDAAFKYAARPDAMVEAVGKDIPSLRVVDPKAIFCTDDACKVDGQGRLFFRDRAHLTNAGSDFLVAGISGDLLSWLQARPQTATGRPEMNSN